MNSSRQNPPVLYLLYFLFAFLFITAAHANTLYVGPAETYTTITDAITAANSGDTIIVKNGTYEELYLTIAKSVTIMAETGHTPILKGMIGIGGVGGIEEVTIKGLTLAEMPEYENPPGVIIGYEWEGNLYTVNKCTIDGLIIYSRDDGILSNSYDVDLIITNNTLEGCDHGISLESNGESLVENNTISNCSDNGVDIGEEVVTRVTIKNNNITNCGGSAVSVQGTATIDGNTLSGSSLANIFIDETVSEEIIITNNEIINGNGVAIATRGPAVIENNTIQYNDGKGILVTDFENASATITNNLISHSGGNGIEVRNSATIQGNEIYENTDYGIEVEETAVNVIINNNNQIKMNMASGVLLRAPATLEGNAIEENSGDGVAVGADATDIFISNNQINKNEHQGIGVETEAFVTINDNTINENGEAGVLLYGSAAVDGNTISQNGSNGLYITQSAAVSENVIDGNLVSGIEVEESASQVNIFNNNEIKNNTEAGIIIRAANSIDIDGNQIDNNGTGVSVAPGAVNINIKENKIRYNNSGIVSDSDIKIRNNVVEDNNDIGIGVYSSGVDLGQDNDEEAGNNSIKNNSNWNVVNYTSGTVTACRNYWGLSTSTEIDAAISDDDEDASKGAVVFEPFLTENPTAVEQDFMENIIPQTTELKPAYPNPFNPETNIQFLLSSDQTVLIEIYDLLGNQVAILANRDLKAGTYTFKFNAEGFASGVYLCRITAGNFIDTKKLVLMR